MKYMGSKRLLLMNGLGDLVLREAARSDRFVDLFTGTGSVAAYVAEQIPVPVLAVDLQQYATALAGAVIERTEPLSSEALEGDWLGRAIRSARRFTLSPMVRTPSKLTVTHVTRVRTFLPREKSSGFVWASYAGHYYSPEQAVALDCMMRTLPANEVQRRVCLAAIIRAAMRCAAAPGHTAQPFQPTKSSIEHIASAWRKDPFGIASEVIRATASRHALVMGSTEVADANEIASGLSSEDLAFVDPPYSSAQYSRYYHVLETVARGECGPVEGAGRYPPISERPSSVFSRKALAPTALLGLLQTLAERRCRVILTFPQHAGSNGIIGLDLIEACRQTFEIDVRSVSTRFSTLGGNNQIRASRRRSAELVLYMRPRRVRGSTRRAGAIGR